MMTFSRLNGFSLLECMMLLAIISLVLSFSFTALAPVEKHQVRNLTTHLYEVLQWARLEAIKRKQLIAVCGTKDFQSCDKNWSYGYMVFVLDSKKTNSLQILRLEKNNSKTQVKSNQAVIKYSSDGRSFTRATIYISHSLKIKQKIVVSDSGRARIAS